METDTIIREIGPKGDRLDARLNERERQLLKLAADGLTDKEICHRLEIAMPTVRTYWTRLRQKVGAANRAQTVALCLRDEAPQHSYVTEVIEALQRDRVGYWVWQSGPKHALLDVTARRLLGFGVEAERVLGRELLSAVWPDDRKRFEAFLFQSRYAKSASAFEFRANPLRSFGHVLRTANITPGDAGADQGILMVTVLERSLLL